jgi:hypothetical protein
VQANQLQTALKNLSNAIREIENVLEAMRAEHDPLAVHLFVSRRQYRNVRDSKSGSRREIAARLSWQTVCDQLGFVRAVFNRSLRRTSPRRATKTTPAIRFKASCRVLKAPSETKSVVAPAGG